MVRRSAGTVPGRISSAHGGADLGGKSTSAALRTGVLRNGRDLKAHRPEMLPRRRTCPEGMPTTAAARLCLLWCGAGARRPAPQLNQRAQLCYIAQRADTAIAAGVPKPMFTNCAANRSAAQPGAWRQARGKGNECSDFVERPAWRWTGSPDRLQLQTQSLVANRSTPPRPLLFGSPRRWSRRRAARTADCKRPRQTECRPALHPGPQPAPSRCHDRTLRGDCQLGAQRRPGERSVARKWPHLRTR